jgi:hypothetical protein
MDVLPIGAQAAPAARVHPGGWYMRHPNREGPRIFYAGIAEAATSTLAFGPPQTLGAGVETGKRRPINTYVGTKQP